MRSSITCLIFISRSALERSSERTWREQRKGKCFRLRLPRLIHLTPLSYQCCVWNLVQVVGQAAVETLHGLFLIGAVAMQPIKLEADRAIEILADRGWTGQWAGCSKRDRGSRASPAGVHQRTTGKGGLAVHGVASYWDAGGHDGFSVRAEDTQNRELKGEHMSSQSFSYWWNIPDSSWNFPFLKRKWLNV